MFSERKIRTMGAFRKELDEKMRDVKIKQKIGCCATELGNELPRVKKWNQFDWIEVWREKIYQMPCDQQGLRGLMLSGQVNSRDGGIEC